MNRLTALRRLAIAATAALLVTSLSAPPALAAPSIPASLASTADVSPAQKAYRDAKAARDALDATIKDAKEMSTGTRLSAADRAVVARALPAAKKARAAAVKKISKTDATSSKKATKALTKARTTLRAKTSKQRKRVATREAAVAKFWAAFHSTADATQAKDSLLLNVGKKLSKSQKKKLESLEGKLKKVQRAATDRWDPKDVARLKKDAKAMRAHTAALRQSVDRLAEKYMPSLPSEKKIQGWYGSNCRGVSGYNFNPAGNWTRKKVIVRSREVGCTRLLELYKGSKPYRLLY